jgi:hypothetical protein
MSSSKLNPQEIYTTEVDCQDRWQVYYRLQELDIPCQCASYQPLKVQIDHPLAAIQLWSVVQRVAAPRQQLADWLETCWRCRHFPQKG